MSINNTFSTSGSALLCDIKRVTPRIASALRSSGYNVYDSIESLKALDRFFNDQIDDKTHKPEQGGFLSENTGQRLFAIGSLVGEVVIKEFGGEWIVDDNDKMGEVNIAVKLSNGTVFWPVQRLIKRCKEGPENGIYDYMVAVTSG